MTTYLWLNTCTRNCRSWVHQFKHCSLSYWVDRSFDRHTWFAYLRWKEQESLGYPRSRPSSIWRRWHSKRDYC